MEENSMPMSAVIDADNIFKYDNYTYWSSTATLMHIWRDNADRMSFKGIG